MINKWETFFLIVLTLPIMGHVVLLPLALNLAGRDSWMSALISLFIGSLFVYSIYLIRLKFTNKDIHQSLHQLIGRGMTTIFILIIMVYYLLLSGLSLAIISEMTNTVFLQRTPLFVIVLAFLLLSMYAALKSTKAIALTAGILFFTVMFTGHSITFINFRDRNFLDLMPFLEDGWIPVILGTILLSNVWIELLFLIIAPIKSNKEKRLLFVWMLGVFANVMMMLSTMTGVIMTFGLGQSKSFNYPALEIVKIININFVDRLDVYALILMTFGSYIRCSLFLHITYNETIKLFLVNNKWYKGIIFIIFSLLVGILAFYLSETRIRLEHALVYYAYTFLLYPIPFILLFITWWKRKINKSLLTTYK